MSAERPACLGESVLSFHREREKEEKQGSIPRQLIRQAVLVTKLCMRHNTTQQRRRSGGGTTKEERKAEFAGWRPECWTDQSFTSMKTSDHLAFFFQCEPSLSFHGDPSTTLRKTSSVTTRSGRKEEEELPLREYTSTTRQSSHLSVCLQVYRQLCRVRRGSFCCARQIASVESAPHEGCSCELAFGRLPGERKCGKRISRELSGV